MKKIMLSGIVAGIIGAMSAVLLPALADASTAGSTPAFMPFGASASAIVSYGAQNSSSVAELQQLLILDGFLTGTPATGNFGPLTKAAVQAFQKAHGISATGNFGPLTMAAVNSEIAVANTPPATVAIKSVSKPSSSLVAAVISFLTASTPSRTISWQTAGYPAGAGVDINLIRKTSDSPVSYTLIRQIGSNVPNSGAFSWTPLSNETGADLYAEVTCAQSPSSTAACQISADPILVQ
jgi:peptidoglycan hydrolase-like protein with peptidoglycan-binding domain